MKFLHPSFLSRRSALKCSSLRHALLKPIIGIFILITYANPVYAIPPPETLAFLGGSLVYSGLIIIGLIGIFFKYVWIKSKLFILWRLYLPWIVFILILSLAALSFLIVPPIGIQNTPVNVQTIQSWKEGNTPFVFIDIRDSGEYDKIHIGGSLNFPAGTGLNNYLKTNMDKKIILYCDNGFKSATLSWLDADQNLLKQVHKEHRLFYFPDGLYRFMELEGESPVPVVINVPWEYAQFLSQKNRFVMLPFTDDTSSIAEYQKLISKQKIPIMSYEQSHDELAEQLNSQFHVVNSYFTVNQKVEPFPLWGFLMVIGILFAVLFFIRRKELVGSMFAKISIWYSLSNLLISFIMTMPTIAFSLQLTLPFDLYLYKVDPDLPMNAAYFISLYLFFGVVLGTHLMFPKKKRLDFLLNQLSAIFTSTKNRDPIGRISWNILLIPCICLYIFYLIPLPLSSLLIISIFLLVPLVVDLLLYVFISLYKNSNNHALSILHHCHYDCDPQGTPFIQINTHSDYSLGTIIITVEKESIYLGLFTGLIINTNKSSSPQSFQQNYDLKDIHLTHFAWMARNLLMLFQQDIKLSLDKDHAIISIELQQNHNNSRVINRHVLLKHHQMVPEIINEQRFTSLPFQETFANPTPLLLSILKQRWSNEGGCIKALRKLGLLIKKKEITQDQFIVFCNQIYIDNGFEQAIFSSNKLMAWIRKKVVRVQFQLATESILPDYHMLMAPKAQIKIIKLTQYLQQSLSVRKLQRILRSTLTALYKQSAMWQFYSSLLHQDAFRQLQVESTNTTTMAELLPSSLDTSQSLVMASYYELSDQANFEINLEEKSTSSLQDSFLNTEYVRTQLRQFQLKEWQLINLLLEKLTQLLELPFSLSYLTIDDFRALPKKRSALIELLEARFTSWKLQNQYQFPHSFSLQDIEQLHLNTTEHLGNGTLQAIRVAGKQLMCMGTAVVFKKGLNLEALGRSSILIADNLLPEQIISCQHIKGVILKKGGYLSHSAIIAREKNMLMIAQFPIETIEDKNKLLIHAGNQVNILKNKRIEWYFLEEQKDNVAIGNKAQRLALLSHNRFNIPDSVILKPTSIKKIYDLVATSKKDPVWQEYYEELKQLFNLVAAQTSIIVRSSTNVEDSSHYSYAGIFYSQANISTIDEFISALCAAWQNMIDRQALIKEYSGEDKLDLHLIIQPYIKGQAGGVLFTETDNPDLMCLEVSNNGIEEITEGDKVGAALHINAQGQTFYEQGDKNILTRKQYRELYQLGHQLETLFGKAQDIEWIIANQKLYVIQSRDISDKGRLISSK